MVSKSAFGAALRGKGKKAEDFFSLQRKKKAAKPYCSSLAEHAELAKPIRKPALRYLHREKRSADGAGCDVSYTYHPAKQNPPRQA